MSVNDGAAVMAEGATSTSCIFLDNNAGLKKTKRKRTSPQDQAILEAAYLNNSKPDKGERATIVSQVDLNEKEVQIWFQNKRQNDRRRSRPLQPHELEAHIHKPSTSPTTPAASEAPSHANPAPTPSPITDKSSPVSSGKTSLPASSAGRVPLPAFQNDKSVNTPPSSAEAATQKSDKSSKIQVASSLNSGRKRVHDEMVKSDRAAVESLALPKSPTRAISSTTKEPLKRSSSMRLAMTVDGAVKIKTSDSPTPSPPKTRPEPLSDSGKKAKLTRATSMFEDGQIFRDPAQSKKLGRINSNFGRSRDARTWEFYCDNGPDDTLAAHAEAERKGSAVSAINLIRSVGSKSRGSIALSPIPTKANLRVAQPARAEKTKLSRARSSLARLQATTSKGNGDPRSTPPFGGPFDDNVDDREKENWKPGTTLLEHELRRTGPSTNTRSVLELNAELSQPAARDESPTKVAADLDCIQGLLSLSQGNWK